MRLATSARYAGSLAYRGSRMATVSSAIERNPLGFALVADEMRRGSLSALNRVCSPLTANAISCGSFYSIALLYAAISSGPKLLLAQTCMAAYSCGPPTDATICASTADVCDDTAVLKLAM